MLGVAGAALAFLAAGLLYWDPLDIDERPHVQRITSLSARSVKADLMADMKTRFLAQTRLAKFMAMHPRLSQQDWELSSELFLDHQPGYLALQWADPTYHVRWAVAHNGWPQEIGLDCSTDPQIKLVLQRALSRTTDDAVITPVLENFDGKAVAKVVVPIFRGSDFAGLLIAVLDIRSALENMLEDHSGLGYSIAVLEADKELYRTPGTGRKYENTWAQPAELPLPGVTWRIRVWPNPDLLADIRSKMPEAALVLGCLLVYYWRAAQRRSRELRGIRDELEVRVKERTLELQRSNENLNAEVAERTRVENSLRYLSARLLQLQDEERRRLARELHDSTAQMLGAATINLDRAQARAQSTNDPKLADMLREAMAYVNEVTGEIRTVSYLLHPPMLDDLGLEYVLPWYAKGFSERSGIHVSLAIQPDLGRLPKEIELALFRITQEALTNIHRHSGSGTATVVLHRQPGSVTMEISDQGCGISPAITDATQATIAKLGVGIAGMRERVRQLGGEFEIKGNSSGTAIRVDLPLTKPPTSPQDGGAALPPDAGDVAGLSAASS